MHRSDVLIQQLSDPTRHYRDLDDRRSAAGLVELLGKMKEKRDWDPDLVATVMGAADRLLARSKLLN